MEFRVSGCKWMEATSIKEQMYVLEKEGGAIGIVGCGVFPRT
jgi:hypothetical protein